MTKQHWRGWQVSKAEQSAGLARVELVDDLDDDVLTASERGADVWIDVDHSSINFKDGIALTGKPGVVRAPTLLAGIDLVGIVSASDSADFAVGDRVLVNGGGLGETRHGGLAERARVPAELVVAVPDPISQSQAAAIGTAGFTAMLAVLELERQDVTGSVLVTGAAGGVGSVAIALLSAAGFEVTASTGRAHEADYLRSLGAHEVIDRIPDVGKPLQSQRWNGAVDSVGGATLANVLSQVSYGGTVAACGLAQSGESTVSLMPFLLRSVRLSGINSVDCPRPLRLQAWERLATDLDLGLLDSLTQSVPLADAVGVAERILEGGVRGRTVVNVRE